jgi:hypothetical protein
MIVREFTLKTSRKQYTCKVCSKPIRKGVEYMRHYTQGDRYAVVMHEKCHDTQLMKEVFVR